MWFPRVNINVRSVPCRNPRLAWLGPLSGLSIEYISNNKLVKVYPTESLSGTWVRIRSYLGSFMPSPVTVWLRVLYALAFYSCHGTRMKINLEWASVDAYDSQSSSMHISVFPIILFQIFRSTFENLKITPHTYACAHNPENQENVQVINNS